VRVVNLWRGVVLPLHDSSASRYRMSGNCLTLHAYLALFSSRDPVSATIHVFPSSLRARTVRMAENDPRGKETIATKTDLVR